MATDYHLKRGTSHLFRDPDTGHLVNSAAVAQSPYPESVTAIVSGWNYATMRVPASGYLEGDIIYYSDEKSGHNWPESNTAAKARAAAAAAFNGNPSAYNDFIRNGDYSWVSSGYGFSGNYSIVNNSVSWQETETWTETDDNGNETQKSKTTTFHRFEERVRGYFGAAMLWCDLANGFDFAQLATYGLDKIKSFSMSVRPYSRYGGGTLRIGCFTSATAPTQPSSYSGLFQGAGETLTLANSTAYDSVVFTNLPLRRYLCAVLAVEGFEAGMSASGEAGNCNPLYSYNREITIGK